MRLDVQLTYTKAQQEIFFPEKPAKFTIVPKGRRFGATKGASNALIEWGMDGISPMLWVDTINANIDRYWERYFEPELKKWGIPYDFQYQKKQLKILNAIIDFRSADAPESIEGFGYKKIILNEAGIILKDNYLYTNTILPMLMDFPETELYAIGTPKGQYKKDGSEHVFYQLSRKEGAQYRQLRYSSYDNPLLSAQDIKDLENEMALMDASTVRQEIYGEFTEASAVNPFFTQYNKEKHESVEVKYDPKKQLLICLDFNLNPFCVAFAHYWRDAAGEHFHIFDELEIKAGNIPSMIEAIKLRYEASLPNCRLTGDNMGTKGSMEQRDNASYYKQLQRGLNIRDSQLMLPANPTHENSRADCNYALFHFPDFKIHPNCKGVCRDMKVVQCDAYGKIIKRNRSDVAQQSDFGDIVRYFINTFLWDWIHKRSRGR